MNDVTALMGKLKANVAYLQFADQITEERTTWPVIGRGAQLETTVRAADAELDEAPSAAVAAAPVEAVALPTPAAKVPASPRATRQASLLRRYANAAADPEPAQSSRLLSDIFARLEQRAS